MKEKEMLEFLAASGKINLDAVKAEMEVKRKEEQLDMHPYKLPDRPGADERWRTHVTDATKKEGRRQIVARSYEELLDKLIQHYELQQQEKTFETLLDDWLEEKSATIKDATIQRTRYAWRKYFEGDDMTKIPIEELDGRKLKRWVENLINDEQLTGHQLVHVMTIMTGIIDYAVDKEYIERSPMAGIKINRNKVVREHKKDPDTEVYTVEEEKKIREIALHDFETRRERIHQLAPLLPLFMLQTGLRVGEACAVKWSDIHDNRIYIQRMLSGYSGDIEEQTKGKYGDRRVYLTDEAIRILDMAKARQEEAGVYDPDGFCLSMVPGKPLPHNTACKIFYRLCKDAGIPPKSSHKARKTYGSSLIDNGVSIDTVRRQLGHTDEQTTLRSYHYDRKTDEEIRREIQEARTL